LYIQFQSHNRVTLAQSFPNVETTINAMRRFPFWLEWNFSQCWFVIYFAISWPMQNGLLSSWNPWWSSILQKTLIKKWLKLYYHVVADQLVHSSIATMVPDVPCLYEWLCFTSWNSYVHHVIIGNIYRRQTSNSWIHPFKILYSCHTCCEHCAKPWSLFELSFWIGGGFDNHVW